MTITSTEQGRHLIRVHDDEVARVIGRCQSVTPYIDRSEHPDIVLRDRAGKIVCGLEMITRGESHCDSWSVCCDFVKYQSLLKRNFPCFIVARDDVDEFRIDSWKYILEECIDKQKFWQGDYEYKFIDVYEDERNPGLRFGRKWMRYKLDDWLVEHEEKF